MFNAENLAVQEVLKNRNFISFLESAKYFCSIIESNELNTESAFLQLVQNTLIDLYSLSRSIPNVDLRINSIIDVNITDRDIKDLLHFIVKRIPFTYYWTVLNPLENKKPEIGTGDLMDDLGDIYKDLKEGILLLDKEDIGAKENALFKFQFGYRHHWGEHCIDALNIIHKYIQHGI